MDYLKTLLDKYQVDLKNGLSSVEASKRLNHYGKNVLKKKNKKTLLLIFLSQFHDSTIYLLIIASILSFILKEYIDVAIILLVLIINAIVGSLQEYKAEKSLEALEKMASFHAMVFRDGKLMKILASDLTLGDIVYLQEGDIVPADLFLYQTNYISIDESLLNGESFPVEKKFINDDLSKKNISARINQAFTSTKVIKGNARGIVTGIGMDTEVGKIANYVQDEKQSTPLQIRLKKLSNFLGLLTILIVLSVMLYAFVKKYNLIEFLIFAISLAVAAIPEGLPAIVTIVLSLGVIKLVKVNAIVRKLPSVETLGSVDVVCTDKTGTITENKLKVEKIFYNGKYTLDIKNSWLEKAFVLNNNSTNTIGDPLEISLNQFVDDYHKIKNQFVRIKEIPFSSEEKTMEVEYLINNQKVVFVKGAFEKVLNKCKYVYHNKEVKILDETRKKELVKECEKLAKQSLKVIAFSYQEEVHDQLVFLAIVGLFDPPRKNIEKSVEKLKNASIKTIMITGDHIDTSYEVAKRVGICNDKSECFDLSEVEEIDLNDDSIEKYKVFSRVNPVHKLRIVEYYQKRNHVVGMTGDGVNDSPALKKADVGIAMGISGSDVSKSSSDIILEDDNFQTIERAIEEGRNVFINIKKSILFLLSSNLGEVIAILFFVFLNLPSPLIAIHILWVNLISDSLPALALGSDKKYQDIMKEKPRKKDESLFAHQGLFVTLFYGVLIAVITIIGYIYIPIREIISMGMNLSLDTLSLVLTDQIVLTKSRTIAFCILSISEIFHMLGMSNIKASLFTILKNKNKLRTIAFFVGIFLQILVVQFSFTNTLFETIKLSWTEWLLVLLLSLTPLFFHELLAIFLSSNL